MVTVTLLLDLILKGIALSPFSHNPGRWIPSGTFWRRNTKRLHSADWFHRMWDFQRENVLGTYGSSTVEFVADFKHIYPGLRKQEQEIEEE